VGCRRGDLPEQFESLRPQFNPHHAQPRHVATRPPEAGDQPAAHRIPNGHHDRNRLRGILGGPRRWRIVYDDEVHLETDELGGEGREGLTLQLPPSVLHQEVLTLDVSQVSQRQPECVEARVGRRESRRQSSREVADPVDLAHRLCLSDKRRHEEAEGKGDEEPDSSEHHQRPSKPYPLRGAA
jgi:hypothetical protein